MKNKLPTNVLHVPETRNSLIKKIVDQFLEDYDKAAGTWSPLDVEKRLTDSINTAFQKRNETAEKGDRWRTLTSLPADVVARVINHCEEVRCISLTDSLSIDAPILGIYSRRRCY